MFIGRRGNLLLLPSITRTISWTRHDAVNREIRAGCSQINTPQFEAASTFPIRKTDNITDNSKKERKENEKKRKYTKKPQSLKHKYDAPQNATEMQSRGTRTRTSTKRVEQRCEPLIVLQ